LELADLGRRNSDRPGWLNELLAEFGKRRQQPVKAELQSKLQAARDHTEAVDLLRQLQKH
jgi:hypothetical protein